MTITGQVFKGYVEAIIKKHTFGTNKMVAETENKAMMNLLRNSESFDTDREIGEAQNWLIANGYIQKYGASWGTDKRHSYMVTACKDYIGLTAKGWSVANKYLNAKN